MSNLIETTRWRADRSGSEQVTAPDPDAARELAAAKLEQRAALAADRENAMVEYEANRIARIANTERLASLRLARDAAAALDPAPRAKSVGKNPAAKAARLRKAPAKPAP